MDIEEETRKLAARLLEIIEKESPSQEVSFSTIGALFLILCLEGGVTPDSLKEIHAKTLELYQNDWNLWKSFMEEKKEFTKV